MKRILFHPYTIMILTTFAFGANAVASKMSVGHISPMTLTAVRWLLVPLLLVPIARPHFAKDWPQLRRHWKLYVFLGSVGFTGFNALFYVGIAETTTIHGAIAQAGMPIFVFATTFLLFRARATPLQLTGFALTLTGVIVTTLNGDLSVLRDMSFNDGDAVVLLAVALYGIYTALVALKPDAHWSSTLLALGLGASVTAVPLLGLEMALGRTQVPDSTGWAVLAFSTIVPSIMGQALYIRGIEMIGANRANLFFNLIPIFATFLAVVMLGEQLQFYHLLALALVIGGIILAERGKALERMVNRPATPASGTP